ncbi:pilin N-terminal domain-containing protein [uncultured Enterococcus sp.]|uniref:pilin N-terminal domain-containing protein n=1 Tax=uncultured Enterococcus sp. TaxID=167972 RepID=UPI0025EE2471|nr:pilin N-terminal domain-containing protein [uncultured Enterococcus sp.]
MKKRILGILAIAFMVIPLLLSGLSVKAEETEIARGSYVDKSVNLTIHALQYDQTDEDGDVNNGKGQHAIPNQQNTGSEMRVGEKGDFTGTPISGVTFDIYDITDFYKEGNNGVTASDIQRAVYYKKVLTGTKGSLVYNQDNLKETTVKTDGDGKVQTENTLPVVEKEKNLFTAYLIVQRDSGKDTLNKAYPMVVTLPVFERDSKTGENTSGGELLTNIHLYPKMEKGSIFAEPTDPKAPTDPNDPNDPKYPVDPTDPNNPENPVNDPDYVGNKGVRQSVDYNQTITYGFNLTIPRGTLTNPGGDDYKISFNSTDTKVDYSGHLNDKQIKLYTKDGEVPSALYKATNDSITFRKSSTPTDTLEGKVIRVLFTTSLKDTTPLDTDIPLKVSGTTKDGVPVSFDLKSVYTGGSHFKVIDSNADNKTTILTQFITNSRFYITKTEKGKQYFAEVTPGEEQVDTTKTETDDAKKQEEFVNSKRTKSFKFDKWTEITEDNNPSKNPSTTNTFMDFAVKDEDITGDNKRVSTTFLVEGLKDTGNSENGTKYQVQQVKSHDLYVNPKAKVLDFTVDGGSVKEMQANNTTTFAATEDLEKYNAIKNVKKGFLPSTGGTGILVFLVVGIALMGGSYIWFKRSKDSAEV